MAYDAGKLVATLAIDDKPYKATLKQAPKEAKKVFSAMSVTVGNLAASALKTAASAAVGFVKESFGAFQVQEKALDSLSDALKLSGAAYAGQAKDLAAYASQLQAVTTYGDEVTLSAMAQGLNMGISSSRIQEATKAAMGLSAAYKMNLSTAMMLVAKAGNGNVAMLSRYGIAIDATKSKEEQFEEVLRRGAEAFPLAQADTFGAKMQQLGNVWGDIKEKVGQFAVGILGAGESADWLTGIFSKADAYIGANVEKWIESTRRFFIQVAAGAQRVWLVIGPVVKGVSDIVWNSTSNTWTAIMWLSDNAVKVIRNLPELAKAAAADIAGSLKNAVGMEGDTGNLARAMQKASISALPEPKKVNWKGFVDGYKNLGAKFDAVDQWQAEKMAAVRQEKAADAEEYAVKTYSEGMSEAVDEITEKRVEGEDTVRKAQMETLERAKTAYEKMLSGFGFSIKEGLDVFDKKQLKGEAKKNRLDSGIQKKLSDAETTGKLKLTDREKARVRDYYATRGNLNRVEAWRSYLQNTGDAVSGAFGAAGAQYAANGRTMRQNAAQGGSDAVSVLLQIREILKANHLTVVGV